MALSWQLGTFDIAVGRLPGESVDEACARWETGDCLTETVTGLVSGPLGVHRGKYGLWTLSATSCGFRIDDSADFLNVLRLAEMVADLDWSGSPADIKRRNSSSVRQARRGLDL